MDKAVFSHWIFEAQSNDRAVEQLLRFLALDADEGQIADVLLITERIMKYVLTGGKSLVRIPVFRKLDAAATHFIIMS